MKNELNNTHMILIKFKKGFFFKKKNKKEESRWVTHLD